jgi:hypothetical protein
MATRRMGLNGDRSHMASVALNRKISLPLLITTNVYPHRTKHPNTTTITTTTTPKNQKNDTITHWEDRHITHETIQVTGPDGHTQKKINEKKKD